MTKQTMIVMVKLIVRTVNVARLVHVKIMVADMVVQMIVVMVSKM